MYIAFFAKCFKKVLSCLSIFARYLKRARKLPSLAIGSSEVTLPQLFEPRRAKPCRPHNIKVSIIGIKHFFTFINEA